METFSPAILIPFLVSNLAALLLALCSRRWPTMGRLVFALLFAGACWFNLIRGLQSPEVYLSFADFTFMPPYRNFINGLFSEHILLFVSLIAVCQALIACGLLLKGILFRTGCIGAIVFLTGIAPLGMGAAFPSSLIMAAGIWFLLHKAPSGFIWQLSLLSSAKPDHEKTFPSPA